jgi:protein required for attachment to host cells
MLTKKLTTWVLICDGARGRILANDGRGTGLREIESAENDKASAPTRDLGTDRPGRTFDSTGGGRHAMASPVDRHRFEKTQFTKEMAAIINAAALENGFDHLVLAAPPRVLGDLRQALRPQAAKKIVGEINKDLTQIALHDLGDYLDDKVRL